MQKKGHNNTCGTNSRSFSISRMTLSQPPFRPVVNNNPEKERVRAASSQRAGAQVSPRGGEGHSDCCF